MIVDMLRKHPVEEEKDDKGMSIVEGPAEMVIGALCRRLTYQREQIEWLTNELSESRKDNKALHALLSGDR
jgi:hypothetical protein